MDQAILNPHSLLSIPKKHTHEFQIMTATDMDKIWYARNLLIHKAIQPDPTSLIQQITNTTRSHMMAWQNSSPGKSVWNPPPAKLFEGQF